MCVLRDTNLFFQMYHKFKSQALNVFLIPSLVSLYKMLCRPSVSMNADKQILEGDSAR